MLAPRPPKPPYIIVFYSKERYYWLNNKTRGPFYYVCEG
jgi:hypothetical protein